jgi:hypothetical protein
MTTGRGNGSYGRHRLGTCPGFFPIGIYRTVTTDAAGWESASASSRGSTTCSRLWDATGSESTPSSAYDQTRRGQRRKGDVPVWESTPAVPTTRLAEVNDASAYDQTRRGQRRKGVPVWESTPQQCLRPDSPRSTTEGRCPGFAADGVWQLVPVPCADSPVAAQ